MTGKQLRKCRMEVLLLTLLLAILNHLGGLLIKTQSCINWSSVISHALSVLLSLGSPVAMTQQHTFTFEIKPPVSDK